jgi:uncharacterized membrane protein
MRSILLIPIMTILACIGIFLNIPLFRDCVVFIYLSLIPGFALLKFFKLKEISVLDTILFSLGLSMAFLMFIGLIVNELFVTLGYLQPLSIIPLTVAISGFTLSIFAIEYIRDQPETLKLDLNLGGKLKNVLPVSIILCFLLIFSALGVLYVNVLIILMSYSIIAALCVICILFKRLIPEKLFPFLLFSISIALICQVLLLSKYIVGWDANLEYYVFRLTQINGYWGSLSANLNSVITLDYNSMLSITLLPTIFSVLMNAKGDIVFKILYPFIFSFIPLSLYRIYEKQFGKLIGLLSVLFFVFTSTAFYGLEPLSLNRQIVGDLFLLLSVFLLISHAIPVTKRRILLIIFGAALVVSHYTLAYIYLAMAALVFVISRVKSKFDYTLNAATVLLIFVITFSWYALVTSSPLLSLTDNVRRIFDEFTTGTLSTYSGTGTASNMFATPQAFTTAAWINLLMTGIANLFLIIGVFLIIFRKKRTGIFDRFRVLSIFAAIILGVSYIAPSIATKFNFTRFYGFTLLFLSPCFVIGGQFLLITIRKTFTKIKRAQPLKRQSASKMKNINLSLLLIAVILGGYFLSQAGFVNRVTGGAIHSYVLDFDRMKASNESQYKILLSYDYFPEQEVFSATWLLNHNVEQGWVIADYVSQTHVLASYGLVPNNLILPLTNTSNPSQGSFIFLGSLNLVNGVVTTISGSFNTSEISFLLDQNSIVYSNGNSEILYVGSAMDLK